MASKKKKPVKKNKAVKKVKVVKVVKKKKNPKKAVPKKNTKKVKTKKAVVKKTKAIKAKAVKPKSVKKVSALIAPKVDYSKAITPLGERLVIRTISEEKVTAGGIIIPDTAQSVAHGNLRGTVLAVGQGLKNKKGQLRPLAVKVGDIVLFAEYATIKIEFNSEKLHIVNESDIVGIIEE